MEQKKQTKLGSSDIAAQLRREINSGSLQRFERVPPERSLASNYNVSRGTIRSAINKLEIEGLVETRAGSGTYISKKVSGENSSVIQNARPLDEKNSTKLTSLSSSFPVSRYVGFSICCT